MSRLISFLPTRGQGKDWLRARYGDHEFYGSLSISREEISRLPGISFSAVRSRVLYAVVGSERPLSRARVSNSRACTEPL